MAAGTGACAIRGPAATAAAPSGPAGTAPGLIRIGSNENPFGPGPAALEGLRGAVSEANRYPFKAIVDLQAAIAERLGVDRAQVILSSGSGELLDAAVTSFTSPARGLVTASPTFEMPANRAELLQHPFTAVRVDAAGRLDLDAMLAASTGAGLVYLCNPNNPTATVHGAADVESLISRVHARAPDAIVLVDEAYHEYVASPAYKTAVPIATNDPRVIVTRTFSKIHGMAGLRVGFAVGVPATIGRLRTWVDSMNMNMVGVSAARRSLTDTAHLEQQRAVNAEGRQRLRAALAGAGYESFESDANFIMVHVGRDPRSFAAACLARGVQVARPFPPLLEHARITVGTPQEMERATRVFLEVLAGPPAPVTTARAWWRDDRRGC